MTYAFSAKNKTTGQDEHKPSIGPGAGETIGDEGDTPKPEEETTFQLAGGPAMPYVEFPFTITASKTGNLNGTLSCSDVSWVYRKKGTWSGTTLAHVLGVQSVKPDTSQIKFVFKTRQAGNDRTYEYSVGYSTGTMSISSSASRLKKGNDCEVTVSYSGGSKCYATSLSSLSAQVSMAVSDNGDDWSSASNVSLTQRGGFANGTQKYRLSINKSFSHKKLRVSVEYAGKVASVVIDVAQSDMIEMTVPSSLHVYGEAKQLIIREVYK